ncbi:MAG: hypothetical protein JNK21_01350, partial [Rhodospirillaceae bacterium]|nr:hypothetical protein [Rhodospirillaceae bacterium]
GADLGIRIVGAQITAAPITPQVSNALAQAIAAPAQPGTAQPAAPKPGGPVTTQPNITSGRVPNPVTGATPPAPSPTPAPAVPGAPTPTPQPGQAANTLAPHTLAPGVKPAIPGAATPPTPLQLLQSTEPQGLRLATPQGLGPFTPVPPKGVETPVALVRLTGQVTATAPNGAVIVQTTAGELQLNIRANVPVGSTLTFEVMTALPPRPDAATGGIVLGAPSPPPAGLPLTTPAMGWGSVTEALQLLQRIDPQTATHLAAAIPDGGPRTALAAMAFVQAMRSGDPRQWPGDAALRGLERAGPRGAQLAAQISGEVREMAARAGDAASEWRTLPLPWNAEGRIERIALILRREGDSDDDPDKQKGGKGKGTRFLINLDLSKLGELQMDGMFIKSTRAFDMMIRTKDALPEHMRRDLMGLFAASNAAMGLAGALTFQVVKKFPDPTATGPAGDRSGLWA